MVEHQGQSEKHMHSGVYGYAKVWVCQRPDCGFIGMYKPEADQALALQNMRRICPSCGSNNQYEPDAQALAKIEMVPDMKRLIVPGNNGGKA